MTAASQDASTRTDTRSTRVSIAAGACRAARPEPSHRTGRYSSAAARPAGHHVLDRHRALRAARRDHLAHRRRRSPKPESGWDTAASRHSPAPHAAFNTRRPRGRHVPQHQERGSPGQVAGGELTEHGRGGDRILIGALGHRGPELVESTVGDIGAAAAGKASPASRRATSRATVSPPPAASPATAIDRALRSWSVRSQRHAARTSSMAAGKGCSGARRYSGNAPAFRWPVPAGRPARRRCEASRARDLRRAGRWSTQPVSVPGASSQWAGTPASGHLPHQDVVST